MAFFDAMKAVQTEDAEVPNHLRDNNRDSQEFGHGAGYLYPHAYRNHWVPQQYLPDGLNGRVFYNPGSLGYEKTIRDEVLSQREMQIAVLLQETNNWFNETSSDADSTTPDNSITTMTNPMGDWWEAEHLKNGAVKTGESLTFSPGDKAKKAWQKRTDSNKAQVLLEIRNYIVEAAKLPRHHRNLIVGADDGLLIWEIWRKTPDGIPAGLCKSQQGKEILEQYSSSREDLAKPL